MIYSNSIRLLDCTLRDGAYVNDAEFGKPVMRGIISKLQDAHVDVIECGWLKDFEHKEGTSFFHVPSDALPYINNKNDKILYCAMIDWNRYDPSVMPPYDGKSIDAVRVVFPLGRTSEAISLGTKIRDKGYKVLFQAANTLAYSDDDLLELSKVMNEFKPLALSVVDTFGAMYPSDLEHIVSVLDEHLDKSIELGLHAHNNQQLAFALCIRFIEILKDKRDILVDGTLSGMGRGAGNATTELVASYIDRVWNGNYDMNAIMDAIDMYIQGIGEKFSWGYSTPYFISGYYQCHVNNIAYLTKNHRTNARDMRNVIESLSAEDRRKYDYDLLEAKYLENQNRIVDDEAAIEKLKNEFKGRKVMLIAPGKTSMSEKDKLTRFIDENNPVVIEVNSINKLYNPDYVFFTNSVRYEYARNTYPKTFYKNKRILLSNIHNQESEDEHIVNFNLVIKRGWEHFDNAVILALRLLNKLDVTDVYLAGFDGFKTKYNESYADESLPTLNPDNKWDELNEEIKDMYKDFHTSVKGRMNITFLTESIFEVK
ncbi:MAG: aldolase catalytic domain-containing protein [Lachnospiraceae bacterium]|nr:aldolase catalytic domain-containing protein [Lachnospiraceae bacterium]